VYVGRHEEDCNFLRNFIPYINEITCEFLKPKAGPNILSMSGVYHNCSFETNPSSVLELSKPKTCVITPLIPT
jgi:hypothetical protein